MIEKTLLMATAQGELAIDLMSGSGTTGEACIANERFAILCDISEEYTRISEKRLGIARIEINAALLTLLSSAENLLPQKGGVLPSKYPCLAIPRLKSRRNQLDLGIQ